MRVVGAGIGVGWEGGRGPYAPEDTSHNDNNIAKTCASLFSALVLLHFGGTVETK